MAVFHVLLTSTRWGLHTIAVGGNPLGATEAGIRAGRIKIGNFMMVATLGGFAGILDAFRINTIDPNLGGGFGIMFTAVSAAVIGGTALAGGSGTVIGALPRRAGPGRAPGRLEPHRDQRQPATSSSWASRSSSR